MGSFPLLLIAPLLAYNSVLFIDAFTSLPITSKACFPRARLSVDLFQQKSDPLLSSPAISAVALLGNSIHRPSVVIISVVSMAVMMAVVGMRFLVRNRNVNRLLWPGSQHDPTVSEPLPPGSFGCPFFGANIFQGSIEKGPEYYYRKASERLGHVRLWKFYFLGTAVASISGKARIQRVLNREFDTLGKPPVKKDGRQQKRGKESETQQLQRSSTVPAIFGNQSIAFTRDKETHSFLRRLIGASLQTSSAAFVLSQLATQCTDRMMAATHSKTSLPLVMHEYSTDYTMEFVQKQLLGIDSVTDEERRQLRWALDTWLSALFSVAAALRPPMFILKHMKPYKARMILQESIERKLDVLEVQGPDGTILSNLFFAKDDGDCGSPKAKLTRIQVIENALFLIAAGAETSSSTLTLAVFMLGLHPKTYQQLGEEQSRFRDTPVVTEDQLKQSPYLDAVVNESLRLGAISGGFPRYVRETFVLDGQYQIPKGWSVFANIRLTHQLDPVTREDDDQHMDPRTGFRPERWLNSATSPVDFMPFGAGARYCLGANLATLEIKVFLATLARRVASYRLSKQPSGDSTSGIEWNPRTIVPRPLDGAAIEALEYI